MIVRRPTDTLITGFAPTTKFRVTFADVTETTHAISDHHDCSPASEFVLAHALATASLMGSPLSRKGESMSVRFDTPGTVRGGYAEYAPSGHLRGYVCRKSLPEADADPAAAMESLTGPFLDVSAFLGRPIPLPDMKASFRIAPASFRQLVETFFLVNFHLPTWARFEVVPDAAGVERAMAVMLQCMRGGDIREFVNRESLFSSAEGLAALFSDPVLETASGVFNLHDLAIERVTPLAFRCDCSHIQSLAILATQPEKDLRAAIEAGAPQIVTCQFCGTSYEIQPDELRRIHRPRGNTH